MCLLGSVLVNMWNHTSFPAYKSRLWDMTGSSSQQQQNNGVEKRKPYVHLTFFRMLLGLSLLI